MSATQFSVMVLHVIKGDIQGTVIVNASGYKNGVSIMSGDVVGIITPNAPRIIPGATYVFATRGDGKTWGSWYTLGTNPYALKPITDDSSLNITQLEDIVNANSKVKALEAAYPNEILIKSDIYNKTTWNSFISLPPEAKAAAVARADAAKAWLVAHAEAQ
jgi:hypothetical protein